MFVSIRLIKYSYPSRKPDVGAFWISKEVSYECINVCLFKPCIKYLIKRLPFTCLCINYFYNNVQIKVNLFSYMLYWSTYGSKLKTAYGHVINCFISSIKQSQTDPQ